MIGNSNHVISGRNSQRKSPAKLNFGKHLWFAGIHRVEDYQPLLPVCIIDSYLALAIIEPLQKTITHAIEFTMLKYRSLPVAHSEGFAAGRERYSITFRMQFIAIEITSG